MALTNALHTKEITTAQVTAVSFGFFSEEEIERVSVKQVRSPVIFDNLKNPIKGGLYDPAFGPLDQTEKCGTCGLTHFECPGHFGHVKLSVPLYNPLVFITLYKLLRCTCLHCFKFRMAGAEVERFRRRMELLAEGRLVEAQSLILGSSAAAKKSGGELIDESLAAENAEGGAAKSDAALEYDVTAKVRRSAQRAAQGMGPRSPATLTSQTLEAMIDTVGELFKRQPTGKCQNCGAHSPAVKREGFSKLFTMPLPPKKRAANAVQGTPILSVLQRLAESAQEVAVLEAELGAGERGRAGSRKRQREPAPLFPGLEEDVKDDDEKGDVEHSGMKSEEGSDEEGADNKEEEANGEAGAAAAGSGHGGGGGGLSGDNPKYLTPTEVKEIMRRMWELNEPLLAYIYPADVARRQRRRTGSAAMAAAAGNAAGRAQGYREFFVQTVPVAPNRFRPANKVGDTVYEHPQNTLLSKLINGNLDLLAASSATEEGAVRGAAAGGQEQVQLGRTLRLWLDLQNSLNALFDSSSAADTHGVSGIRQQLEKKEGLFRKNMMGKRVNFAARSVISPDVYLNGGEIGVPPYFASRLSFPERVAPWNVARLREAVVAGPGRNPGAVAVEDEKGRIVMLRKDKKSREAVAKTLYANPNAAPAAAATAAGHASGKTAAANALAAEAAAKYGGGKVVYRTMTDGDFMLTNRQPTLHKPGMMGHRARIMRAERTIRFHYANCATFNADFDGDEINLHLPQDHAGRAEGYNIVAADEQFFAATDGKPLRGLIQDHIVAGTLLTCKDCFLTQAQFCQLVTECVALDCSGAWDIWLPPPVVLKPRKLWTGKQVVTAVLMHYTRDQLPFTLCADSKVPADVWGKSSGEGRMLIWRNHLVAGVVDKGSFGKHGLLHIFYELYGAERTSIITAALSRLFTAYLQQHGFTCGMSDVFLVGAAEETRRELLSTADVRALEAAAAFAGTPGPQELVAEGAPLGEAFSARERAARAAISERFRSSSGDTGVALDMKMSGAMHPLSSEVVKACLPGGQARPFRHNMMALMTVTGAKGSVVNFSQISCLLGQQELEGRRVPRMASGKTLPCFAAYDVGARSGGFVGDRFLTGLRPQEYYFHCMAGREGLVDTTVKTSRSGYLQRCLVKNLEPLKVAYDSTVRDECDGSVVQFLYGEDGLDPTHTGCLRTLPLLFYNSPQFAVQIEAGAALDHPRVAGQTEREAEGRELVRRRAKALMRGREGQKAARQPPVNAQLAQAVLGVTSEGFQDSLTDALFGGGMLPPDPQGVDVAYKAADKKAKRAARRGLPAKFSHLDAMDFQRLMHVKYYRTQAPPGESVGVIAAQSVGEPSTQMTLNTFHMAGRGEANVTLGIPRLREILMTAAATIKTPVMTLPLRDGLAVEDAARLAVRLKRIRLAEALKGLRVEESVVAASPAAAFGKGRVYTLRLQFHPPAAYPPELGVTFEEIAACFTGQFVPRLQAAVRMEVKKATAGGKTAPLASSRVASADEEGGAMLASEDAAPKRRRRSEKDGDDENAELEEENEEGKLRYTGGHGEQATYDVGDAEDVEIEKAARLAAAARAGNNEAEAEDSSDSDAGEAEASAEEDAASSRRGGGLGLAAEGEVDEGAYACEAAVTLDLDAPKLLMRELAERVAAESVMRGVKGISKCYVLDASARGGPQVVQTDGINISGVWLSDLDLVDVDRLTTNNPAAMLATFGVEAARATIVREVSSVFGAYGIGVDPRHLSLIADHMTQMGGYRACNRVGIEASTSPFLKITFETAAAFLVSATLHGDIDPLTSPAARIVLGQPVHAGTGSIDLVQRLDAVPFQQKD